MASACPFQTLHPCRSHSHSLFPFLFFFLFLVNPHPSIFFPLERVGGREGLVCLQRGSNQQPGYVPRRASYPRGRCLYYGSTPARARVPRPSPSTPSSLPLIGWVRHHRRRSLLLHWLLSAKSPPPLPLGSSSAACDPHSSFLAPQSRMSTRAARGLAGGVLLPRAPCFLGTDRGLEGRGSRTNFNFGALGTPTAYRPGRRHLVQITSPEGAGPFLSTHLALCLKCCFFLRPRAPLKGARAV